MAQLVLPASTIPVTIASAGRQPRSVAGIAVAQAPTAANAAESGEVPAHRTTLFRR